MRDLIVRIGARVLASLLQAISLMLLARWLGADVFGSFGTALACGLLVGSFLGLGTTTLVLRIQAYSSDRPQILRQIDMLRFLSTLCLLLFSIGFAWFLELGTYLVVFTAFFIASDYLNEYLQSRLAGQGRHLLSVFAILCHRVALVAFILIMYSGLNDIGTELACVLVVVEFLIQAVVLVILAGKLSFPKRGLFSELLKYWGTSIVGNLRQLEVPVVTAFYSSGVGGTFVLASRIMNPLLIVTSSMQAVFVPKLSQLEPGDRDYAALFKRIKIVGVGYAVLLAASAPLIANILIVLAGDTYSAHIGVIYATIIAAAISATANVWQIGLYAMGHPSPITYVVGSTTVLGLLLYFLFGLINLEAGLYATPVIVQSVQSLLLYLCLTNRQNSWKETQK